jgi:hypothetical protein
MAKNEEDLVHYVSVPPRLPENLSWMRKSGSTILAGVRRAWGIEEKELKLSKEALDIALHEDLDRAIADCLEIRRNLRRRALDEGYDPAVVDSVIVDEIASVLKKHRKAKARLAKEDAEQVRWLDPDLRKLAPIIRGSRRLAMEARRISRVDGGDAVGHWRRVGD